ncbi:hypothetical protein CALVIDRAFT_479548 [Calocera viscosa TUFC12733]|uniref:CxC1-like cysteine cluster associated with KDZ transposases domain-containing protein n=1 Tax=Calocera viscosa (strain TUFC12733) TaxID=1330018 RepID=A0A167NGE9_CALVF|nr:hypothetical protein CALVIDRAFT_479548 [Calocera viscosa TUFC12733]
MLDEQKVDISGAESQRQAEDTGSDEAGRQGRTSKRLRRYCPACFAQEAWGRAVNQGPDVIVCADGNRQLRRFRGGVETTPFYAPEIFISSEVVDAVGEDMARLRVSRPANHTAARLSAEALERCKKSFKVADEDAALVNEKLFDPTGVVVLLCRHDIPLLACDITTPGEQQKYVVAMLLQLLKELPKAATVGLLYDIGCQLDHSCRLYGYLGAALPRIIMGCSVLHAYGHEWACQVAYNPRRREGFGLSDGEGSERVWSRTRREIPILRRADKYRRMMALDRKFRHCGETMKENLGRWFNQKFKLLALHRHRSDRLIQDSGMSVAELAEQHQLQVEQPHSELMKKGEQLFTELHIEQAFPEFRGVSSRFLHFLMLARQEKLNIRERIIGHMWELARLQRARGGGREPLGTKLRDQILRGYGPRWNTTQAAIRRYNGYIDELEKHFNPAWNIPLPLKLNPDRLESPTEDHHLLDDVWWPAVQPPPAWVTNEDVRHGVTGWLLKARCNEEQHRLEREADNVVRWWMEERQALHQAIARCSSTSLPAGQPCS